MTSEAGAPTAMSVPDAMRYRTMRRTFAERPLEPELLQELVWAASRAQQVRKGVRHLVVVDDPALLAAARQVLPGFINNAPAMIVHCTDIDRARHVLGTSGADVASRFDAGAACAHLALMAQAIGVGVCTVTSWTEATMRSLLDLPAHIRPDVTMAVGHLPGPPSGRVPQGFPTAVHRNTFGSPMETVR